MDNLIEFYIPDPKWKIGESFQDNLVVKEEKESWYDDKDGYLMFEDFKVKIVGYAFILYEDASIPEIIDIGDTKNGKIDLSDSGRFVYHFKPEKHEDYEYSRYICSEGFLEELCLNEDFYNVAPWLPPLPYPDIQIGDVYEKWMDFNEEKDPSDPYFGTVEDNFQLIIGYKIPDDRDPTPTLTPLTMNIFASGCFNCIPDDEIETAKFEQEREKVDYLFNNWSCMTKKDGSFVYCINPAKRIVLYIENPDARCDCDLFLPPGITQSANQ